MKKNLLVFDLETQRDARSVGGWGNIAEMRMSVGVVWDTQQDDFFVYEEPEVEQLIKHLTSGARVVGFNQINFDHVVLSGYRPQGEARKNLLNQLVSAPNLDILQDLTQRLKHRVKLDQVVTATLNTKKSADGLQALVWFAEYQKTEDRSYLEKIIHYCKQDVAVTRDLYLTGLKKGEVFYETKYREIRKVSVDWADNQKTSQTNEQLSLF